MNENGSFEDDESVPTVITGTDPYTATASASFTSKFSLGGIKALALGALVGGGGGSQGGGPPSLKSVSLDSIIIDEISSVNNYPTQTLETGVPFELRLPFYEDNGASAIEHVAIYVLHDGYKINDSELYLVYDKFKPTQIFDPHGYVSDFDVNIEEKSSHLADIVFGVTFAKSMEPSDIIVRAWDNYRRSADYKFNQLIKVESSGDLIDDSELISLDDTNNDNLSEVSKTNELVIPAWIKFNADWWSQDKIGDDDFIAGIKFLIEEDVLVIPESLQDQDKQIAEIPAWVKSSAGWWSQDLLSDKEFVQAIQWLIEKGILSS